MQFMQKRKKYIETLPYSHRGNMVTSLLWPLFLLPGKTARHFLVKNNSC